MDEPEEPVLPMEPEVPVELFAPMLVPLEAVVPRLPLVPARALPEGIADAADEPVLPGAVVAIAAVPVPEVVAPPEADVPAPCANAAPPNASAAAAAIAERVYLIMCLSFMWMVGAPETGTTSH
jgi:hypothetical protein